MPAPAKQLGLETGRADARRRSDHRRARQRKARGGAWLLVGLLVASLCACGGLGEAEDDALGLAGVMVAQEAEPAQHELMLTLRPDERLVEIRAEVQLRAPTQALGFWLWSDAEVIGVEVDGRAVALTAWRVGAIAEAGPFREARRHTLTVPLETPARVLVVRYRLRFDGAQSWQTAAARARPWVGPAWTYLPSAFAWYPRLGRSRVPVSVEVDMPRGFEACAEGTRIALEGPRGRRVMRFESETPSEGLTFVAGRWERQARRVGDVELETLLLPAEDLEAGAILDWVEARLPLAERRLGPYPFARFVVVEHPFQTLTAFAGYALIEPALLRSASGWKPAIAHELLHGWLGHLVFLGPGGDWIEGLVTYLAEHDFHMSHSAARGQRFRELLLRAYRTQVFGVRDEALGSLRIQHDHATEVVSYAKAALVFHMLRQRIGERTFDAALRQLTSRYRFQTATWDDVLAVFEMVSEARLAGFSVDWIEREGAPQLALIGARDLGATGRHQLDHVPHRLQVHIGQTAPGYPLRLPVEVALATGVRYRATIELDGRLEAQRELIVPGRPEAVCIDPGFDVFRALNDDEVAPTLGDLLGTRGRPLLAADPALSETADLVMAAALAGRFDRATLEEALAEPAPLLAILPYAALAADGTLALGAERERLPVQIVEALAGAQVALVALPRPPGAPPRAVALVADPAEAIGLLMTLDRLGGWSFVGAARGVLVRRGVWQVQPASVCRPVAR